MNSIAHRRCYVSCVFAWPICMLGAIPATSNGHEESVFVQSLEGQLITGILADSGTSFDFQRVYTAQLPSTFAWNNPGFHSLSVPPAGLQAIPEGTDVYFDILPMTFGGVTANLLYWDGIGTSREDVQFRSPPDGYSMTLFGRNNQPGIALATDEMVAGTVLGRTLIGLGLRMHEHRYFYLDDGDDLTDPVEGVYLMAMQLRMDGLRGTAPFYMVWGTLNTPISSVESIARPWVADRVDDLIRKGDFNFDGLVDTNDDVVWAQQLGYSGPFPLDGNYADANRDGIVDEADRAIWQENLPQLICDATTRGDLDSNGAVDFADFLALSLNFGNSAANHTAGDIDCNGAVDFADFLVLSTNFGTSSQLVALPEPTNFLEGLGIFSMLRGMFLIRQRREETCDD